MSVVRPRTIIVVAVTLMMVLSLPGSAMAGSLEAVDQTTEPTSIDEPQVTTEQIDTAESVYVDDEGDAVLTYEATGGDGQGEYAFDATERLLYAFIEDANVNTDEETEAELTTQLSPNQFQSEGS